MLHHQRVHRNSPTAKAHICDKQQGSFAGQFAG
uniref:Uncharacterized protein n=1 Tax=Anguilla anguilla TaxID=7936 RepID=A0A0E9U804_ANGAN